MHELEVFSIFLTIFSLKVHVEIGAYFQRSIGDEGFSLDMLPVLHIETNKNNNPSPSGSKLMTIYSY